MAEGCQRSPSPDQAGIPLADGRPCRRPAPGISASLKKEPGIFYEAIPAGKKKTLRLLDVNSPEAIREPEIPQEDLEKYIPAETGAAYFNKLFCLEREFRELPPKERQKKRMEQEVPIWENFFRWLGTLNPAGGSRLEKAVNYALNHKDTLQGCLQDGRCELSNNRAERNAKSYAIGRKNVLSIDKRTYVCCYNYTEYLFRFLGTDDILEFQGIGLFFKEERTYFL